MNTYLHGQRHSLYLTLLSAPHECVCLSVCVCVFVGVCVCVCVFTSMNAATGSSGCPAVLLWPVITNGWGTSGSHDPSQFRLSRIAFKIQTILPLVWDPGSNGRTSINVSISCRPLNGGQGPIRSQIMPAPLIDGSPLRGKPVRSLGGGHPQTQTHSFTSRLRRSPNATQLVAV